MRTKTTILPSYVARTTKYAWVVVATLIVALVLWGFLAAPRVFAITTTADDELLAANPELVYARAYSPQSSGAAACVFEKDYAAWAANPELMYLAQAQGC
jgi:hypothetical protein